MFLKKQVFFCQIFPKICTMIVVVAKKKVLWVILIIRTSHSTNSIKVGLTFFLTWFDLNSKGRWTLFTKLLSSLNSCENILDRFILNQVLIQRKIKNKRMNETAFKNGYIRILFTTFISDNDLLSSNSIFLFVNNYVRMLRNDFKIRSLFTYVHIKLRNTV